MITEQIRAEGWGRRSPRHPHIWGQAGGVCPAGDTQEAQGDLEFSSKPPSGYRAGSAAAVSSVWERLLRSEPTNPSVPSHGINPAAGLSPGAGLGGSGVSVDGRGRSRLSSPPSTHSPGSPPGLFHRVLCPGDQALPLAQTLQPGNLIF